MSDFVLPRLDFWDDAAALEQQLGRAASALGPSSFLGVSSPGLLMWRDRYQYVLAHKNDTIVLLSTCPGEVYAPRPPAPFTETSLKTLYEYLAQVNGPAPGPSRVEGLTEAQAEQAKSWGYQPRLLSTDFVYDRSKLAGLHGDSFRDRRNEMNRISRDHETTLRPFTASDLPTCADLYQRWKEERAPKLDPIGERMMEQSQKAHQRLLANHAAWGLQAWVLEVDRRLAAYSVVGPLSEDTLGVWAEVSDLTVRGAAAYIFVQLCREHSAFAWVNSGDAEFLPGLKDAKERWHPAQRLDQFALDPIL